MPQYEQGGGWECNDKSQRDLWLPLKKLNWAGSW